MIVVDTCVVTHLFNETELTPLAQEVLSLDANWRVPSLWREEYANVLAKLYSKSKCRKEDVLGLFETTCNELINGECKIETSDALLFAMEHHISVYDAHFVVLADQLDTFLITEDQEVLKKCKHRAVSMKGFLLSH